MAQQFRSPINLQLPVDPNLPEEMMDFGRGVFRALRSLQEAIGSLTGASLAADPDFFHQLAPTPSQSIQVHTMQLVRLEATAVLVKGQFVNIFLSGGVAKTRLADASALATRAWGWAMESTAIGAQGMVALMRGYNGSFAGNTVAGTYYLSSITPGGISLAVPVGAGKIVQEVGIALSATDIFVNISTPIVL